MDSNIFSLNKYPPNVENSVDAELIAERFIDNFLLGECYKKFRKRQGVVTFDLVYFAFSMGVSQNILKFKFINLL